MREIWKDIKNYEGSYQVSNLGRVRSLTRKVKTFNGERIAKGRILKPLKTNTGYYRVDLKQNQKNKYISIHRLVAEAFIPNPNNYQIVNHKDNNPQNNYVDNLEWCTQSYNVKYSYTKGNAKPTLGCFKKGRIPHNLRKVAQYDKNGNFLKLYNSITLASQSIKRAPGTIHNCLRGKTKSAGGYVWRYAD